MPTLADMRLSPAHSL